MVPTAAEGRQCNAQQARIALEEYQAQSLALRVSMGVTRDFQLPHAMVPVRQDTTAIVGQRLQHKNHVRQDIIAPLARIRHVRQGLLRALLGPAPNSHSYVGLARIVALAPLVKLVAPLEHIIILLGERALHHAYRAQPVPIAQGVRLLIQ